MPARRVVCAGHVNWDVTMRVDRLPDPDGEATIECERGAGGGSAANVAVGLVGLGVDASLLGSVGDDERGRQTRSELAAAGVDTAAVVEAAGAPTATKYLVVDDEGQVFVLGRDGANEAFTADDLPASTLESADWLHLTGQDPGTAATLAARARGAGVTVSSDPGRRVEERGFEAVVGRSDVVFLNEREAAVALDAVPATSTAVVKRGARGAEVRSPAGTVSHGGFAVDAVDTTGAGDAFAAGYIAARLDGDDEAAALTAGNACGALAASRLGARVALDREAVSALCGRG
jgi:ribokinase